MTLKLLHKAAIASFSLLIGAGAYAEKPDTNKAEPVAGSTQQALVHSAEPGASPSGTLAVSAEPVATPGAQPDATPSAQRAVTHDAAEPSHAHGTQQATARSTSQPAITQNSVIQALDVELKRSMNLLKAKAKAPIYFLAYKLYEGKWDSIVCTDGAVEGDSPPDPWRMLSVELRVGSPRLDNTHFLRGENSSAPHLYDRSTKFGSILPGAGAGLPLRQCLWLKTDDAFKQAQQRYFELCANTAVMSTEEDRSGDFCPEPPHFYAGPIKDIIVNRAEWKNRIRDLSRQFLKHPSIEHSTVSFESQPTTAYIVNSEGSQITEQSLDYGVSINASTITDDGMTLWLWDHVHNIDPAALPDQAVLSDKVENMAKALEQLRQAPPAESYTGPAILSGKAAAVFFHETFGHRVEAVHEKNETEGKTFAKRIGTSVMPKFISVIDDPTVSSACGQLLNGHYKYDDEGVPAQKVVLAKNGCADWIPDESRTYAGLYQIERARQIISWVEPGRAPIKSICDRRQRQTGQSSGIASHADQRSAKAA